MTRNEQLAAVIRLACLTECRTDSEQRALIAWAWDCDRVNNRVTVSNRAMRDPKWQASDLVSLVHATRTLEEGDKAVPFPKRWAETTRCVRPDHLLLGTQKDNVADTVQRGRLGARPGSPKLTPEQVAEIRQRHSPRRVTYAMLAEEYGVSYSAIQNICRGKTWKAGERAGASRERSDPALPDSVQPQFTGAL